MWLLLSVLACHEIELDDTEVAPPPPGPVSAESHKAQLPPPVVEIPRGEATYRPECFRSYEEDGVLGVPPLAAKRGAPTGAARPALAPSSAPTGMGGGGGADGAVYSSAAEEAPAVSSPGPVSEVGLSDEVFSEEKVQARTQGLEWGATVYLSNDDSMSLASAQRVLYAVKEGKRLPTSQIRPHELLNYFTFDTAPVREGELFSVQGAGARTDEQTLSVALAVKGATPPREPLDLTLVIDRSGSMAAEGRMSYTKRGLHLMEEQLRRGDRVDVVLFDDEVCTPLEDYVVGRDDPSLLTRTIDQMRPRGSTDLDAGLEAGYRLATARESKGYRRNQRVMLLTDAFLNTGDVNPDTVTEIGRAFDDHHIRLTGVGVGRDFNDKVLDMLTEKGKGAYVYLGSEEVVDRLFGVGFDSLTRTIAHDVHFALDLPDSLAMERFYGEEASTVREDVQPIHYYAGTSQVFLQDLRVDPKKIDPQDELALTISYRDADTGEPGEQRVQFTVGELLAADPHNLDKARALMAWTDLLLARSMGGDPCGEPLKTYTSRAALLQDDAEIGYVNSLVRRDCPAWESGTTVVDKVTYKVKIDADQPIAEVKLECGDRTAHSRLSGSDTVARFMTTPGECKLVLEGVVPLVAAVTVPETGGDLRCLVRGGRLSCD